MKTKHTLVCDAGGFIGGQLLKWLKRKGYWLGGADIKHHEYAESAADEFLLCDLTDTAMSEAALNGVEERYQFAADMGGYLKRPAPGFQSR